MKSLSPQQHSFYVFHLINALVENKSYIKAYGKSYRAMDAFHNPIINVNEDQLQILQDLGIVRVGGFGWELKVQANPFKNFTEIQTLKTKKNVES